MPAATTALTHWLADPLMHALNAGLSYARWSTEAISALEFSQYEHYMQPRIHTIMSQIGYCGLDSEPEHGASPGAPVNRESSLDSFVYCKGYVAWDCSAIILQVRSL